MSLLSIAKEIKKDGFDPRKDSVNGAPKVPEGKHLVLLKKVDVNVTESGWEMLAFEFEYKDEQYKGRKEFANFGTLTEWKGKSLKWSVERTLKFFQKIMLFANDEVFEKDFEDAVAMMDALNRKAVGQLFYLVTTDWTRDDKSGRNYDVEEYVDETITVDVEDDDLPF